MSERPSTYATIQIGALMRHKATSHVCRCTGVHPAEPSWLTGVWPVKGQPQGLFWGPREEWEAVPQEHSST